MDPKSFDQILWEAYDDGCRRIEADLRRFIGPLNAWIRNLLSKTLPPDWRQRLGAYLDSWEPEGFEVDPDERRKLERWIENWARLLYVWPKDAFQDRKTSPAVSETSTDREQAPNPARGAVAIANATEPSAQPDIHVDSPPAVEVPNSGGRGDQSQFAREAEDIVSEATNVPRNLPGPNQQTIPGSGPGGYRVPDLVVRGKEGSVRSRGTVIEIKASRGKKFGDLSARSRKQIEDAVKYVSRLQEKANLVHDPARRSLLRNAHVEVFSDLPQPKSGDFAILIERQLLRWNAIPRLPAATAVVRGTIASGARNGPSNGPASRPKASGTSRTPIGRPGAGTVTSVALGIVVTLVEANIASELYKESAAALNDLLRKLEADGDLDEAAWRVVEIRLKDIASMRQSVFGYVWEFITYGQGSLAEKQAIAMLIFASELADKYGYRSTRTWSDAMDGKVTYYEKQR